MGSMKFRIAFAFSLLISSSVHSYAQSSAIATALGNAQAGEKLPAPTPMVGPAKPVDWLFIFKFNSATYPMQVCNGADPVVGAQAEFGGNVQPYKPGRHSQQYAFASSANAELKRGIGCVGTSVNDPLGATFAQVYKKSGYNYVVWNDQFYGHPIASADSPMGHSKGMLAWNDDGEGFVLQVSTPSWPGSGSEGHPRIGDGNTLGSMKDDDVEVSQHFFALKLKKDDVALVLKGLANASVVTKAGEDSIFLTEKGPSDLATLAAQLGSESKGVNCTVSTLSSGVKLISKPSKLALPPWQLVSGELGGVPLRVASWWAKPLIYSTTATTKIEGWPAGMKLGAVEIATSGTWDNKSIGLKGDDAPDFNHAKIGVSTDVTKPLCIFGDMNQQGALRTGYAHPGQPMTSSQNGRGGTFYVLENKTLFDSLTKLLKGETAPVDLENGEEVPRPLRRK